MPTLKEAAGMPAGTILQVTHIDCPPDAPEGTWLWGTNPVAYRGGPLWTAWEGAVIMLTDTHTDVQSEHGRPVAVTICNISSKGCPSLGTIWYRQGAEYVHVEKLPSYAIVPIVGYENE